MLTFFRSPLNDELRFQGTLWIYFLFWTSYHLGNSILLGGSIANYIHLKIIKENKSHVKCSALHSYLFAFDTFDSTVLRNT